MVLEEIIAEMRLRRPGLHGLVRVEIHALCGREALWAFQRVWTAGEPPGRQPRGLQPVLCGASGMQRLAHRAEHRFQPGGHRRGDAVGRRGRLGIQPNKRAQAAAAPMLPTVAVA